MHDVDWNDYARFYDSGLRTLAPHKKYRQEFVRCCEMVPGMEVLDTGCGTGLMLEDLLEAAPSAKVLGLDNAAEFLSRAADKFRGNPNVRLANCDLNQEGWPVDGQFDRVISALVLYTLRDPEAYLGRVRGYLRPGCKFVLSNAWRADPERVIEEHRRWLERATGDELAHEASIRHARQRVVEINKQLAAGAGWKFIPPDDLEYMMREAGFVVEYRDDNAFAGTTTIMVCV